MGRHSIQEASTVILLRPAAGGGFETLLTRRSSGMGFLGGIYVFPGGTVNREDCSGAALEQCHGLTPAEAAKILGGHLGPTRALGFWVAAVREVYEEVGILFCVSERRIPIDLAEDLGRRLQQKRRALLEDSLAFLEILDSEKLLCDALALSYFAHWLTPEEFPVRFDTRFYLARLPEGQIPLDVSSEVAHSLWIRPETALKSYGRGELAMIFPTFASLRTLANFESIEDVFAEYPLKA
jgi:8-oxo-dGTP pyrophosphatase MutT (NUDIX family)